MASRSAGGGTVLASGIRTRERKERKLYSDDWALGDEEIEGHHTFNLEEKISTAKFNMNFVKDMEDTEFNLAYMQRNGFNWPLLFKDKKKLGIIIPNNNFSINDVRLCVGSRRMLDVMDVNTQKNVEMTMKDWQRYYESQDKDKLLNVISLEFSHTKLETLVEAPTVVRQIDWVEKVWPRHLKEAQTESTNVLEDMMYPKVQKYCLMSVSGCYTDFHIDFGGTSVWYHILKGRKIFWLIPPSERNLQLYEQWVLSGKQSDIFFGDTVEKCARVQLEAGDTFFIPTGWIHAVYTPEDSLVFGGNFLHSFGIEKQLRVATVEDTTHVPQKFRYPFFTEMLWYLLERYVHVLLGRTHLTLPLEEQVKYENSVDGKNNNNKTEHMHLTQYELHGLKAIVMFLHSLPTTKKFVPELIKDPIALIRDVRTVVEEHRYDSPELAVTNLPVLDWWEREPVKYTMKRPIGDSGMYMKKRRQSSEDNKSSILKLPPNVAKVRHRRVRCKECEPCTRKDCQECVHCRDMVKYGGPGTMKQTCKSKKCTMPALPAAATCYICKLDGWMRPLTGPPFKPPSSVSSLMECGICYKISHTSCIENTVKGVEGVVNEDVPNSWECSECVQLGYNKEYRHNRAPSCRISSAGSDTNVKSPIGLSETEDAETKVKMEPLGEECSQLLLDEVKEDCSTIVIKSEIIQGPDPSPPRMPVWEQLQKRVSYPLVRPSWVVRPAPAPLERNDDEEDEDSGSDGEGRSIVKTPISPTLTKEVMFPVFMRLSKSDLLTSMRVCRAWAKWAIDPSLWKSVSLAHQSINVSHLHGIVRRQPSSLRFDWSKISHEQFSWLICRLPQLVSLHVQGLSWGDIRFLVSPYCPPLSKLDLSYCEGVDDNTLGALLRPPPFNRPGHRDTASRLRQLTHLRLAGTQVGDIGVGAIVRTLPFLTHLDLSACLRLTDHAPELLAHAVSLVSHSLTNLDLRGCHRLTPLVLPALVNLPILSHLALDPCKCIPLKAIKVWGTTHGYVLNEEHKMSRNPPSKNLEEESVSDCEGRVVTPVPTPTGELLNSQSSEEVIKAKPLPVVEAEATAKERNDCDKIASADVVNIVKKEDSSVSNVDIRPKESESKVKKVSKPSKGACVKETPLKLTSSDDKIAIVNLKKRKKEKEKKIQLGTDNKKESEPNKQKTTNDSKLENSEKTTKKPAKQQHVQVSDESKNESLKEEIKVEKKPSKVVGTPKEGQNEKILPVIISLNQRSLTQSPVESGSSESCRRSERSNKGRKYKINLAERKARDKQNRRDSSGGREEVEEEEEEEEDEEEDGRAKLLKCPYNPTHFRTKHLKMTKNKNLKRKIKKDIITRSKRQKSELVKVEGGEQTSRRRCSKRMVKDCLKGNQRNQNLKRGRRREEIFKARLAALKSGKHYVSKLRKKARESSSPSSSLEGKNLKNIKDEAKTKPEEPQATPRKVKERLAAPLPSDSFPQSRRSQCSPLIMNRRKERTDSASSSPSSSPSQSPSSNLPPPKKLKVELEPICKIGRRRSDSQKGPHSVVLPPSVNLNITNSPSGGNGNLSSSGSSAASAERSSSRERPERQHRSPRRLSMCQ